MKYKLNNKYVKWYNNIVDRGKIDRPGIYTESHHIIPECFFKNRSRKGMTGWLDGDPDALENLTRLTGREHFICHWLLTKMYEGIARDKMINAMMWMQGSNNGQARYHTKITARVYENLRMEFSAYISNLNTGRVPSDEERQKISDGLRGKTRHPLSDTHKQKLSNLHSGEGNPMAGRKHTEETKRKISEKMSGRKQTPEEIENRISKIRGRKHDTQVCPYCGEEVAVNVYALWHGDNCKENPNADLTNRVKLSDRMHSANPMKNPNIAEKISGDNHWTHMHPENIPSGDKHWMNTNPEAKERFLENHPNKDGAVAKRTAELGHNVFQTNNPSKWRSEQGIHHWQNGNSPNAGGKMTKELLENGTHNFLGPETNRKRVEDGSHNFLGSDQNAKMLAEGKHPSQTKKTCEHCGAVVSIGMYKRWHGDNCKHKK